MRRIIFASMAALLMDHRVNHTGDFLEIEGSPARDPEWRVVSALTEIRRLADGWRWVRPDSRTIE